MAHANVDSNLVVNGKQLLSIKAALPGSISWLCVYTCAVTVTTELWEVWDLQQLSSLRRSLRPLVAKQNCSRTALTREIKNYPTVTTATRVWCHCSTTFRCTASIRAAML